MRPYYTLPLKTFQLQKKQRHALCDMKEAIAQHVHLLLKTHLTEYRYDYDFGCYIWDQDFENIQSISKWEHALEEQVKKSIKTYEKRLAFIEIRIKVEEPKSTTEPGNVPNRLKRRINISVSGMIPKTREPFLHQEFIYFSPLSIS
jgi:phage baseplate assembly protein W